MTIEEAQSILEEACEALPEGIFEGLSGGVSLLPRKKHSGDGRLTLGLYYNDFMGRRVELFFGSMRAVCETDEELRKCLVDTLHHELRHHIEGKAGDRSLEIEDERETEAYLRERELARFPGGTGRRRTRRPACPESGEEA